MVSLVAISRRGVAGRSFDLPYFPGGASTRRVLAWRIARLAPGPSRPAPLSHSTGRVAHFSRVLYQLSYLGQYGAYSSGWGTSCQGFSARWFTTSHASVRSAWCEACPFTSFRASSERSEWVRPEARVRRRCRHSADSRVRALDRDPDFRYAYARNNWGWLGPGGLRSLQNCRRAVKRAAVCSTHIHPRVGMSV